MLLGIVGEVDKDAKSFYMWTHKKLDIGYNQDAIVDVNLTSEAKVKLEPGARISFTYEVGYVFGRRLYGDGICFASVAFIRIDSVDTSEQIFT